MLACGAVASVALATPAAAAEEHARAFSTRHASFVPQSWADFTAWQNVAGVQDAFATFVRGCASLKRKAAWRDACERAEAQRPAGADAVRQFFEREFVPYRIVGIDLGDEGLLTGYFEPELPASRERRGKFVHPVYGEPADLLVLDLRALPPDWASRSWVGRIDGRTVHVLEAGVAAGAASGWMPIERPERFAEPLDRRMRLKASGGRLVMYPSRQALESAPPVAPVLAWVDDPDALYAMQVQGSGVLRFADGGTVRVGYAEQNGHPFLPRGLAARPASERTRGIAAPGTRVADDQRVQQLIDQLLQQATPPPAGAASTRIPRPAPAASQPVRHGATDRQADAGRAVEDRERWLAPPLAASGTVPDAAQVAQYYRSIGARQVDPSYVFFRELPRGLDGPLGALGVPLTPGRSIAVDPRVTPLGAPALILARRDDSAGPVSRVVVAQDTGGAIRGAVRADFFWGGGSDAGARALRTRELLALWVMLPRAFAPPPAATVRTRGIGDGAAPGVDCTMPDEQYCAD